MSHDGVSRSNSTGGRICVRCSARLAADNHGITCTCHRRTYDPRIDATWPEKLTDYLAENVGRTVYPHAHFGIRDAASYVVKRRIHALRRDGWTIAYLPGHNAYRVIAPRDDCECGIVDDDGEIPTEDGEIPT